MEPFSTLSPAIWKEEIEMQNGIICDVRIADEFGDSYIDGAKNLDVLAEGYEKALDSLNKKSAYFLYCRTGSRSKTVMETMKENGFEKVFDLEGGIMQWEFKGFEVEYGDDF